MSRPSRLTLARLNDLTLGSFAFVPSSQTLEHLVRYLATWNGSDKLFMIIQYGIKVLVPILELRAKLQHRAGLRKGAISGSAEALGNLGRVIGDSRTLWRIWGLFPTIQWLTSLERNPRPTRKLLTIERLQGWSMLAYYPLEHIYYLWSNGILPSTVPSLSSVFGLSAKRSLEEIGRWSSRFWALYVLLQIAHLREDHRLLKIRERNLRKAKGTGLSDAEKDELCQSWDAYWNEVVVNVGYLPLTVHWSLKKGLFKNDVWVGVFGLIAALASFRSGWKATALTSKSPNHAAASQDQPTSPDVASEVAFDV